MSALADIYFKTETLEKLLDVVRLKGEKGLSITVSINDETNQWDQNISCYVSQTKEQREAKKDRFYVANGKVFWTDGTIVKAEKAEAKVDGNGGVIDDNLPF